MVEEASGDGRIKKELFVLMKSSSFETEIRSNIQGICGYLEMLGRSKSILAMNEKARPCTPNRIPWQMETRGNTTFHYLSSPLPLYL